MADHTVTIKPGYALDPPTIGGPPNPIFKGDTVTFMNQAGDACMLYFKPPSPFGNPTIGPIPNNGSASPDVKATVKNRTSFPYTCSAATATAAPAAPATPSAPAATAALSTPTDVGDGVIIVDGPGGGNPRPTVTSAAATTTTARKSSKKPKSKAKSKPKAKPAKGKSKAKPKSKGKGKAKSKAKKKH